MRILHIITSLDRGGAESHLFELSKNQKINGHDVSILYFKGNGYWKKKLQESGVEVFFYKLDKYTKIYDFIFLFKFFKNIFKKKQFNIVHCHLSFAEIIGFCLKIFYRKKIKFIISKHLDSFLFEGSKGKDSFFKGIFLEKIILTSANKVICISKNVKEYFKKILYDKKKFHTIYYGFKVPKLNNKKKKIIKKRLSIKPNEIVITNIARHVKQKNLFFLLDVMQDVIYKKKINIRLIMIGNGPLNVELKNLARYTNIDQFITWVNFTEDIVEYLSLSDIFLLTSDYEGLGLVLLEAMAAKVPIVANNKSAIPEIVKNNYNGLLYKHNSKFDCIKSLELLIKDKEKCVKFSKNGTKILQYKFKLNLMLKKIDNLYKSSN